MSGIMFGGWMLSSSSSQFLILLIGCSEVKKYFLFFNDQTRVLLVARFYRLFMIAISVSPTKSTNGITETINRQFAPLIVLQGTILES